MYLYDNYNNKKKNGIYIMYIFIALNEINYINKCIEITNGIELFYFIIYSCIL